VSRRWVLNSSPVILLAKISGLDLLSRLTSHLVIPSGVAEEIADGPDGDPSKAWLAGAGAPLVVEVQEVDPLVASWDLGLGESQVLTWAHSRRGFEAILDDGAARKCADSLRVPVRGTLGVIMLAKREGLVPKARPLVEQLLEVGYRIDTRVIQTAMSLTGE